MGLRRRLIDLDARVLGAPRDPDEAFRQTTRYWWVGVVGSVVLLVAVLVAAAFGWFSAGGAALVFVPALAFASGYYYAHRLLATGERSRWLDHRTRDADED